MNNVCECLDLDHLFYLSLTSNWGWIDYCGLRRADKPSLVPPVPLSIHLSFISLYPLYSLSYIIFFIFFPSHSCPALDLLIFPHPLYPYIPFISWPSHIISYLYPRIDWACVFLDSRHFRHLFRIFPKLIQASTHSEKYISKTTYYHSFGDQFFYVLFARLGMFESTI